jgi:hypothetical protein
MSDADDEKGQRQKSQQDSLIEEWVGAWALKPENERDQRAAELAQASIKFSKAASFISPVAVAAIDILGIRSLLSEKSIVEVTERLVEPFYDLTGPAYTWGNSGFSGEELEKRGYRRMADTIYVSVSDTILLARRPDWEIGDRAIAEAQAVVSLAEYVCKIIKINSFQRVPLRAAIAFGECLISVRGSTALLGLATGEASDWERQQEWIGGMLTPSAVSTLRAGGDAARKNNPGFKPKFPDTLTQYPIPLKPNCPALPGPQIALNWVTGTLKGAALFYGDGVVPDEPSNELPDDIRRKHLNTRAFAEHCRRQPSDFFEPEKGSDLI